MSQLFFAMPAASARSRGQANRFAHKQSRVRPQSRRRTKHQKRNEAAQLARRTAWTETPDALLEVQDKTACLTQDLPLDEDNAGDQCWENQSLQLEKLNKLLDDDKYWSSLDDRTKLQHRYVVARRLVHPIIQRWTVFQMLFLYNTDEDDNFYGAEFHVGTVSDDLELHPTLTTVLEMFKRKWINTADYAKKIAQLSCQSTRLVTKVPGEIDELTEALSCYVRRIRDLNLDIYEVRSLRNLEIKVFTDVTLSLQPFIYIRYHNCKDVMKHRALLDEYVKWIKAFIHAWADALCWMDPHWEA